MPDFTRDIIINAEHPCFVGHFPGNPIVPGVVILDYVRDLLAQWQPSVRIKTITHVKFPNPLLPDQTLSIHLTQGSTAIKFECTCNGLKIANGALLTEPRQ